ncbi:MAG TPA: hypothetical protein VGF67_02035 [Ktedonobacteraceae bacterium]|jgi:hypothetical protein
MLKPRTPAQMRQDALSMGIKKARKGCAACAERYFDLARRYGTSEQEILLALQEATHTRTPGLGRRDLIKYAVAGAGGLITTATAVVSLTRSRPAQAFSSYFGIDSNTTICCQMPLHFYAGRMGYGIYPDTFYYAFRPAMARLVGHTHTFGYWGVQGPGSNPGYTSTYRWGVAQAQAAWNAWNRSFIGASYVGGYTVFGDVEQGFGGWDLHIAQNQAVIAGFLDTLFALTPSEVWPGLYVSPEFWNRYLGGNRFVPVTPFVLWICGVYACAVCGPCDPACASTPADAAMYFSTRVRAITVGGQNAVLWQYWLTNPGCDTSGCGDWSISSQLARALRPTRL